VDTLVSCGAAAWGVDDRGALAATRNGRGAGHAALIGTFASLDYSTHRDAQTRDAIVSMLRDGLELPIWAWEATPPRARREDAGAPAGAGSARCREPHARDRSHHGARMSHTVEPLSGRLISLGS